jgi:hypothetical protein
MRRGQWRRTACAYLESLRKDGEPLPYEAPEGPITERLTVELASA